MRGKVPSGTRLILVRVSEQQTPDAGNQSERQVIGLSASERLESRIAQSDGGAPCPGTPKASSRSPGFIPPMAARLVETLPSGGGWLFEVKFVDDRSDSRRADNRF